MKTRKTWLSIHFTRLLDRFLVSPRRVRPMGLIAVQMSINPFELYWTIAICVISTLYLIGAPPPSSLKLVLPLWAVYLWAGNLFFGGLSCLIGGLRIKRPRTGLVFYQFGWALIGIATLIYGLTVVILFPRLGLYVGITNIGWSVACLFRVLQVQRFFLLLEKLQRLGVLPADIGSGLIMGEEEKSESSLKRSEQ